MKQFPVDIENDTYGNCIFQIRFPTEYVFCLDISRVFLKHDVQVCCVVSVCN